MASGCFIPPWRSLRRSGSVPPPSPRCEIFDGVPKSCTYHKVMQHSPTTQGSAHLQVAHAPLVQLPPPPALSPPATQNVWLCGSRATH
eukprot:6964379-Prymnesium_polylepis.1